MYPDITYGPNNCPGMGYFCTGLSGLPFYLALSLPGLWPKRVNAAAASSLGAALDHAAKPLVGVMATGAAQLAILAWPVVATEVGVGGMGTMATWGLVPIRWAPAATIAARLLERYGGSVTKSLPEIMRMRPGQDRTIEILEKMYQGSGRDTGGVQTLADGAKVLLSRRLGAGQSILVVARDGAVRGARATIELTNDIKAPLQAIDIEF